MSLSKIGADSFQDEVLGSDKPVLVDFYADWCGPCKAITPVLESLEAKYQDKVKIVKVNIDDAGDIAGQYSVMSIPTLVLFKAGEEADRMVGGRSQSELESFLDAV